MTNEEMQKAIRDLPEFQEMLAKVLLRLAEMSNISVCCVDGIPVPLV